MRRSCFSGRCCGCSRPSKRRSSLSSRVLQRQDGLHPGLGADLVSTAPAACRRRWYRTVPSVTPSVRAIWQWLLPFSANTPIVPDPPHEGEPVREASILCQVGQGGWDAEPIRGGGSKREEAPALVQPGLGRPLPAWSGPAGGGRAAEQPKVVELSAPALSDRLGDTDSLSRVIRCQMHEPPVPA